MQFNTKYYYELGTGHTTRKFWFMTPPAVGPDVPYTFGIMGNILKLVRKKCAYFLWNKLKRSFTLIDNIILKKKKSVVIRCSSFVIEPNWPNFVQGILVKHMTRILHLHIMKWTRWKGKLCYLLGTFRMQITISFMTIQDGIVGGDSQNVVRLINRGFGPLEITSLIMSRVL